jgi:hypothetical protein
MTGDGLYLMNGLAVVGEVSQAALAQTVRRAARGQARLGDLRPEPIGEALIGDSRADQPRFQAGGLGHCQHIALGLQPWQLPPISPTIANHLDAVLREPYGDPSGRREAGEVIKKLSALGLSKYEPDPAGAITAAEAKRLTAKTSYGAE